MERILWVERIPQPKDLNEYERAIIKFSQARASQNWLADIAIDEGDRDYK